MTPLIFLILFAGVSGLCLGSFLNVVAYRLPTGASLVSPGSSCPGCDTAIRPYDNLPVISWLALRGHCRACDTGISPRYPLTEAGTGALFVLVVLVRAGSPAVWLDLCLVVALVAITLIDLDYRIIPDRILLPLAVAAIALTALLQPGLLEERAIAAVAGGGILFLVVLAYPRGMGMGDVKLVAVLGLVLGRSLVPALFVAFLAGSLFGVVVMARRGVAEGRRTAVPFGPFLALGGVVGILAGPALVHLYLDTFTR